MLGDPSSTKREFSIGLHTNEKMIDISGLLNLVLQYNSTQALCSPYLNRASILYIVHLEFLRFAALFERG